MNSLPIKSRRQFLALSAATGLSLTAAGFGLTGNDFRARAEETPTVPVSDLMAEGVLSDFPMGQANSPCTIVEYASMTCSHCAAFHAETYPTLKAEYIDTGKVRFILREFPLDPLAAVGFMLARYAGPEKRNAMVDLLFAQQKTWAFTDKNIEALEALVKQTGMTKKAFDDCLADKPLYAKINEAREVAMKKFGVSSTPTFFINGTRHAGGFSVAELRQLVDPLVAKAAN